MHNKTKGSHGAATISKTKILVVDDDRQLLSEVRSHLEKLDYEVTTAEDGIAALKLVQSLSPDLVVLDINFSDSKKRRGRSVDGVDVLRMLRDSGNLPVLMLSSTNNSAVKAMALSMGANVYLTKPVVLQELRAGVEAILRRIGHKLPGQSVLSFCRLRLDPSERRVWKDGEPVDLSEIDFDILYALARHPEQVFTRDKLIKLAWKSANYRVPKAVDVHVRHIRKMIEDDPSHPAFIVTVRGTGYRFENSP